VLVFLDETFRTHVRTGARLGVLAGVAIPEDILSDFHYQLHLLRRPYHGQVLREDDEIKGRLLLNKATLENHARGLPSLKRRLAEDLLHYSARRQIKVFGVVCFRDDLHTFVCDDELKIDQTYRYLFERIDRYMRLALPGRFAKIIFDDRGHRTNAVNARAITNFFHRSSLGRGYDTLIRNPFFATSQGHNYGLQMADLVTTVVGLRFQGNHEIMPLYRVVRKMLHRAPVGGLTQSSLKVMR